MVFLSLTPDGLADALKMAARENATVWCGADAISEDDFAARRIPGLSRFVHTLGGASPAVIAQALATIEEHHPGQRIWAEARVLPRASE